MATRSVEATKPVNASDVAAIDFEGRVSKTSNVAEALFPSPPSVEVTVPVVLR